MLPEPFTAVASSVGLLSSLFTLLITSVRTVHDAYGDFKTYRKVLRHLKHRVKDVERQVRAIEDRWGEGKADGENVYRHIFGESAAEEATSRAQSVQDFLNIVSDVFRKGYDIELWRQRVGSLPQNTSAVLQPGDTSAWKEWATQAFADVPGRVRERVELSNMVAKRIAFAMIRRADLEKKIGYLEQAMKSLTACLEAHIEQLPNFRDNPPQIKCAPMILLRLHRSGESFARYLSDVFAIADAKGNPCAIHLDLHTRELMSGHLTAVPPRKIELSASIRDVADFKIVWPGIPGFLEALETSKNESNRLSKITSPFDLPHDPDSLHAFYSILHQWHDEELAVYQKYSEDERYRTILSLFTTTTLLWNTPWMTKLCTCNLEPRHTFETESSVLVWPESAIRQRRCPHPGLAASKESHTSNCGKLARLALVICEIALCSPVMARNDRGKTKFSYRTVKVQRNLAPQFIWCEDSSAEQLIADVQKSMIGLQRGRALSALLPLYAHSRSSECSPVTYIDACGLLERDHDVAKRYYEDVYRQHRQDQSGRRWSQSFKRIHDNILQSPESAQYALSSNVEPAFAHGEHSGPAAHPLRSKAAQLFSKPRVVASDNADRGSLHQGSRTEGESHTTASKDSSIHRQEQEQEQAADSIKDCDN